MSLFVCLTAAEWRNLCSNGRIRLQKDRAVEQIFGKPTEAMLPLFSKTFDRFAIGDSSDLIVAELWYRWSDSLPITSPTESLVNDWLFLHDVFNFSLVQDQDRWIYDSDAEKIGIKICPAKFQNVWALWSSDQLQMSARMDGFLLAQLCQCDPPDFFGTNGNTINDILVGVINTKAVAADESNVILQLLKQREALHEICRADTDSSAFWVSCTVEWVNLVYKENFLERDSSLSDFAFELFEKLKAEPFSFATLLDPKLQQFLKQLTLQATDAFNEAVQPLLVAMYTRYLHKIHFGKIAPEDVLEVVRSVQKIEGSSSSYLIAFLLGIELGSARVQSLSRSLKPERFFCA
jgi:hypothetical protein